MSKNQKYILTVFLSFIFLFIITSMISYYESVSYHNLDNDFYIAIKTKQIQPLYNNTSLWIWCIGMIILTIYTYLCFRSFDDPFYKKYLVDFRLLFKALAVFIGILYFIGISGEFFPTFYIGEDKIYVITETEYKQNINTKDSIFDKEKWIEV